MSFQGRLFKARMFPAPTEECIQFSSQSRCLIDMGSSVFIVVLVGEGLLQRGLFRLEVERGDVEFADDSRMSKEECLECLEEKLASLPNCDIVGVNFPFFHPAEVQKGLSKDRPCVALYGGNNTPPIYIAVFMGAPRSHPTEFELALSAPDTLLPASASNAIVDCSKICTLPEAYNRPQKRLLHGKPTWEAWLNDPRASYHPSNFLRPTDPAALRNQVVQKLITMARDSPHSDYVDLTLQYDIGTVVEGRTLHKGEWCECREHYTGPPGYSTPKNLTLITDTTSSRLPIPLLAQRRPKLPSTPRSPQAHE